MVEGHKLAVSNALAIGYACFRCQLTVIGGRFAQAVISKKIANNQFTIHTNATNVQVSWQITAVRQECLRQGQSAGGRRREAPGRKRFLSSPRTLRPVCNKQTEWGRHPQEMQRMKAAMEAKKNRLVRAS